MIIQKKTEELLFYKNFTKDMTTDTNFKDSEWYKLHIAKKRHRLSANCPEDVNLLDVLEMVVDCTCAGLARSGEITDVDIDEKILIKALANTATLIKNMLELKETEK